ncbi:MAG: cupin domain-containing protein [Dongiaceae bacterium]
MEELSKLENSRNARAVMERLNEEASKFHIWLRTQANAPAQRPWFKVTDLQAAGRMAEGRVGAAQIKSVAHRWRWSEISPFLGRIADVAKNADVPPIEFADRQQFLLTNPGLGNRLQIAATIRCAVSIYNPGDLAPVHLHTPNASRTILSEFGGYTNVEGERCEAARGDLILTPNGCWHDHGNDGAQPVVWVDILDWPLMEFLDCIWLDGDFSEPDGNASVQPTKHPPGYSRSIYGTGGLVPTFVSHRRGIGHDVTPYIHFRGTDISNALAGLRREKGSPFEGVGLDFVNPVNGSSLFPTLAYGAQMLRAGEETEYKRETSNTVYIVLEGSGQTEIGGQTFDWERNDIFVAPNFLWRKHANAGSKDAILYTISDRPLMEKIGQYRAQGMWSGGTIEQLFA